MSQCRPWTLPAPLALPMPRPGTPAAAQLYRSALAIAGCIPAADRAQMGQHLRQQLAPLSPGAALSAWVAVSAGRAGDAAAADAWLRAVAGLAWPDH